MSDQTNSDEQKCDTSACSSCSVGNCSDRSAAAKPELEMVEGCSVKKVIGVVSGKGGVGKSLVTCMLACKLNSMGYKVGILDSDVTGPSVPRAFGLTGPLLAEEKCILPAISKNGIKVISTNLLLKEDDTPVIWRGPVVSNAIKEFFSEVKWDNLDFMLVDMPPGTSDALLTVFHNLPVDGIVTVSTPQDLVGMIVGKAVKVANQMEVPVLGLVENMSYFICDECDKKHYIYGEPQAKAVCEKYGIDTISSLPMDSEFASKCDAGKIEEVDLTDKINEISQILDDLIKQA